MRALRSALFASALCSSASATGTFTVNTTLDMRDLTPLGDGVVDVDLSEPGMQVSLRGAIEEANNLAGLDTIFLPAGIFALTLDGDREDECARGDLDVLNHVEIWGAGSGTTFIDALAISDRVFHFRDVYNCVLGDLTVRRGSTRTAGQHGGGILVKNSELQLLRVELSENTSRGRGGAICARDSELVFSQVRLLGNEARSDGGGLYFKGQAGLSANECYFSGNRAEGYGGGIYYAGGQWGSAPVHLEGCTFSENRAERSGGGLQVWSNAAYVTNVTFSRNVATRGGAIALQNSCGLDLKNTTLARNRADKGSGIFEDVTNARSWIYVTNSIFANKRVSNYRGDGLISWGGNLDNGHTCGFDQAGDLEDTPPILGLLRDNGGWAPTIELLAGSPAIDAGDDFYAPDWDQRHLRRVDLPGIGPKGISSDIGAFERQTP